MRHWVLVGIAFVAINLLLSCETDSLTRKKVPIWVGISVADSLPRAERKRDLDKLKELGFQRLMLLVPLSKNTRGLPRLLPSVQQNLKQLMAEAQGFSLSVQLYAEHPDSLFIASSVDSKAWLEAYSKVLKEGILPAFKDREVEWMVLGRQFTPLEAEIEGWESLCDTVRRYSSAKLTYGTMSDRISLMGFWPALDAIGVLHEPSPSGDYKAKAREENTIITRVAQQHNKPLVIVSAGLLGADKELKFKNALRFYSDSTAIQGICLITLFANSVFTDSISAFGVINEPKTIHYLQEYVQQD